MSLFSRPADDKSTPASAGKHAPAESGQPALSLPPMLKAALLGLADTWAAGPVTISRASAEQITAWIGRQDAAVAMDVFAPGTDAPLAVLLLPASLARAANGQAVLGAFHLTVSPLLTGTADAASAAAPWYVPHALDKTGLQDLAWQLADWASLYMVAGTSSIILLMSSTARKRAAAAKAAPAAGGASGQGAAAPGLRIPVLEPGEFHLARLFLPLTMRRADMTIRCRLRALRWRPAGEAVGDNTLYAVRWTLAGEHLVFWLACPAGVPPTMLRTLLLEGATTFKALSGSTLELAGPVAAKGLDPRLDLAELAYEVTVRKQTTAMLVLLPATLMARLHKLFCEPWEMALLPGADSPSGLSILLSALSLNRSLLTRGIAFSLATPEQVSEEDIACALYDRIDALPEHDLTIIVQNHLIPRGTQAVLDCFFPRGGFDPLVWNRVTKTLGEKLTLPLAQALKEGKNKDSGLNAASLGELVGAVNTGRLELSLRGKRLIGTILGGMLDGTAKKQLQPIMDAGLPGVLLARLPPDQRMKALTEMVERERLIAFFGQRDHVLTLMEGFSSKGKERALEDFDVLAKAWEKGAIPSSLIIASKNEAVCFIARHVALQTMGAWPASEWKKFQESLSAEELLFFIQEDEASCFYETPLRPKLLAGLTKDTIQGIQGQLASQKKEAGWQPKPPAFIHRDLAERFLAELEDDEIIPSSKPTPAKPKPRR